MPELSGPPLELLVRSDPDGNPEATPIALPFDPAASPAAPVPDGTFCWPAPEIPAGFETPDNHPPGATTGFTPGPKGH